jgi:hypothetical protein
LLRDCRSASGEDGAFEDDGEATIRFEPLDRREQESADDADRRDMQNSCSIFSGRFTSV